MASYFILGSGNRDSNSLLSRISVFLLIGFMNNTTPTITINAADGLVGLIGLMMRSTTPYNSQTLRLGLDTRKTFVAYSTLDSDVTLQAYGSFDDQVDGSGALINRYALTGNVREVSNLTIAAMSNWTLLGTLTDLHGFCQVVATASAPPTTGELLIFLVEE